MSVDSDFRNGVYEGPDALKHFLNPDNYSPVPLVELPPSLNPFHDQGVRIFAKLMYLLPLLSIKSLPSFNLLLDAQASGRLRGVRTVVENSSGNTAFSLAIFATLFGIEKVLTMVPWDIAPGKLDLLRLSGAEPRLMKDLPGEPSGIATARELGKSEGFFSPGQYENEANPAAFEKWMAPEIWAQTKGRLTVFAASLGTTGTLVGSRRYFSSRDTRVKIVGALCAPGSAVPGVRSRERLREIAFAWEAAADSVVEVSTKESYVRSMALCRVGLLAGPSSGLTLGGVIQFLRSQAANAGLDDLRNREGEVVTTFVCCDTPLPYLDKYSTHLDAVDF